LKLSSLAFRQYPPVSSQMFAAFSSHEQTEYLVLFVQITDTKD